MNVTTDTLKVIDHLLSDPFEGASVCVSTEVLAEGVGVDMETVEEGIAFLVEEGWLREQRPAIPSLGLPARYALTIPVEGDQR